MRIVLILLLGCTILWAEGKRVSLVLGSGGARGYAHIGVIEELERQGYEIVSISGSSMGALVGGLYAAGGMKAFKEWVSVLDMGEVLALVDFSPGDGGLVSIDRVFEKIGGFVTIDRIEDLPIRFVATATDLKARDSHFFDRGPLLPALQASTAMPTLFKPVEQNGRLFVDGGTLNPLPIAAAQGAEYDQLIVVDVGADEPVRFQPEVPEAIEQNRQSIYDVIVGYFESEEGEESPGLFSVASQTINIMQEHTARRQLADYPADVTISISRQSAAFYEFNRAWELIEIGRLATREALSRKEDRE
jgi:NTE family protein